MPPVLLGPEHRDEVPSGPPLAERGACPKCGALEPGCLKTRRVWKCKGCKKQFSIKVGTVLEDSPIGLDKWLVVNCKNGVSSCEVARALGVAQKTAWFMVHRLRLALQAGSFSEAARRG